MAFTKKNADAATTAPTNDAPKSPKGFVDATKIAKVATDVGSVIASVEEIKKRLDASAAEMSLIEEARRQEASTFAFDLKMKREGQLAVFLKQDEEREASFTQRETFLTEGEEELCSLLGVPRSDDHMATAKTLRLAFAQKIEDTLKAGEGKGKGQAKDFYETAKKIDDAAGATKLALLTQENEQLKVRNAALDKQNVELLANQSKVVEQISSVAKGAFDAAGGVVSKGNEALGTAAGAGRSPGR